MWPILTQFSLLSGLDWLYDLLLHFTIHLDENNNQLITLIHGHININYQWKVSSKWQDEEVPSVLVKLNPYSKTAIGPSLREKS